MSWVSWVRDRFVFQNELAERRRAQGAVRASQALLQAISDHSHAVIYVKDLSGRYLMVNRRFSELFHIDIDSIVGRTDYDVFSREAAERVSRDGRARGRGGRRDHRRGDRAAG